jgi:sarcosine oxidase subunit gamma
MSEAVSALNGATIEGFVKVAECGLSGMITLRGDLGSARLKKAVKTLCGVEPPARGHIAMVGEMAVAWMSPDELLLMVPHAQADALCARLDEALSGDHALAVNVSDARAVFRVSGGAGVREVIAKLCPVDMSASAFGPGQFRRTRLAQIPAAIWMPEEGVMQIVCFRSVAQYAFDLLKNAAMPGSEVGLFS